MPLEEEWYPYIKPTRHKHESGFYCFEVGYCTVGEGKMIQKIQIGGIPPDHISIWDMFLEPQEGFKIDAEPGAAMKKALSFDFDCLEGGYIRVFNRYHGLHWSGLQSGRGHTMSSMMFAYGWPNPDPLLIAPNN